MMQPRTVKDRLREEYFELLPAMRRTLVALEAEVRHLLLPVTTSLHPFEQVRITSRIKECESAIDALRRRREGGKFDPSVETYSLTLLHDLVGFGSSCSLAGESMKSTQSWGL